MNPLQDWRLPGHYRACLGANMVLDVWVSIALNVSCFAVGIAVGVYFTVRRMGRPR